MSGERLKNEVQLTNKRIDAATSLFIEETTVNLKSDTDTMGDLLVRAKVMFDDVSRRREMPRS